MPCYATGSREGDLELAHTETKEALTAEITRLTRILCAQANHMEAVGVTAMDEKKGPWASTFQEWWREHQNIDRIAELEAELAKLKGSDQ